MGTVTNTSPPDSKVEAMVGQPIGLGDMLEQVAAERCPGVKRPEADHVVVISQIGLNIDPEQFSLIDMDDLDPAGAQGAEQLILDPRLHNLADIGRAAAEVEHRSRSGGKRSTMPRSQRASASNIAVSRENAPRNAAIPVWHRHPIKA